MPCLEISMPRVTSTIRAHLAESLTAAFAAHSGVPADIFGIRFSEYDWGQAASGGQLCTEAGRRPYLHMLLYTPRLESAVKRRLGEALTTAFVEAVGISTWMPVIHLAEHPYDNVVVEGKLLTDAYPALAERSFYYSMDG